MSPSSRPHRRGAAAIEFAMWLPVLIMFLSAVVDWGHHWNQRVAVARAVMEGTRSAATVYEGPTVLPPGSKIAQKARDRTERVLTDLGIPCPSAKCVLQANWCNTGAATCGAPPFQAVRVRVQLDYAPLIGMVPTPTSISEEFVMATEYQRLP
ncbi:MAG: pilus assembly protein [Myxococcota bacterium]